MLIVCGERKISVALVAQEAEIGDAALLLELVVVAPAVRGDVVAVDRGGHLAPGPVPRVVGGHRALGIVEAAEDAGDARRRRQVGTGLGDDVDDAAHRAVAVEHAAAVAARDLDVVDAFARNGAQVDALEIDIVDAPSIDQHQRIGGGGGPEAAHVDGGLCSVHAAEQTGDLDARLGREDVLHRGAGRARDPVSYTHLDVYKRQHVGVERVGIDRHVVDVVGAGRYEA